MERIDGKAIASEIKNGVKEKINNEYISKGREVPTLCCIIVEGNAASEIYVASKEKACKACGMGSKIVRLPNDVSQEQLLGVIDDLNADDSISGILLQLPIPKHLDYFKTINRISPAKDVDCLTNENLGKLFAYNHKVAPCTASGIIKILQSQKVDIAGKRAVVVGRSLLVGKSVANLLEENNATVTVCHSKTTNLAEITKTADILIVAIGKPKFITADYVKEGAVVIDVGINRTDAGIIGDVDYDDVAPHTSAITPVPGGVGPLTVAMLMDNTLTLHRDRLG